MSSIDLGPKYGKRITPIMESCISSQKYKANPGTVSYIVSITAIRPFNYIAHAPISVLQVCPRSSGDVTFCAEYDNPT